MNHEPHDYEPHQGQHRADDGYGHGYAPPSGDPPPNGWHQVPPQHGYPAAPHAPAAAANVRRVNPLAVLALAVATVVAAVLTAFGAVALHNQSTPIAQSRSAAAAQQVDNTATSSGTTSAALQRAAQAVVPGMVYINTELGYQNGAGAGTGIVLSSSGEVLTNNHVISGATSITATDLDNGRTYPASVVGYDRKSDVAVVKLVGASGLTTAPLGDSTSVKVGDPIVGVGNAGGGGGNPSAAPGRVTGLEQSITASDESSGAAEQLTGLIQIAANIQPGDSGGPLVSEAGKVIGMNTAASQGYRLGGQNSGGGEGFAIPIAKARSVASQITAGAASSTVHIGDSAMLGVTASDAQGGGAAVQQVLDGSAAAQVLAAGDTITALDGKPVASVTALTEIVDTLSPGRSVSVRWVDTNGQQQSATITLQKGAAG